MARGLAVAVLSGALSFAMASPALAVDVPVAANCTNLQQKMLDAQNDPVLTNHHVVTLTGICNQQYTLPAFASPTAFPNNYSFFTLKGDPSNGPDGFDGSGLPGRVLTGNDVHRLLIQDLTFRDSSATDVGESGGAIELTGETGPQIFNCSFFNNHATNRGGAVHLSQEPAVLGATLPVISALGNVFGSTTNAAEGNGATIGGALSVETPGQTQNSAFTSNLFANNVASGNGGAFDFALASGGSENFSLNDNDVINNMAGGWGGGGHVVVANSLLRVDNELYEGNSVEPVAGHQPGDHLGGGLYLQGGVQQLRHNTFRGNAVKAFPSGGNYGGGGLAVRGPDVNATSEYTRIEGNTLAAPMAATQFESEGGGLFFNSDGGRWQGFLDAIAGNAIGDRGEGGGIYVGAAAEPTSLELAETTVAGNSVGAGGQFAGIAGDPQDDLTLWNSIVYNSPQPDIGGFDAFDIQYSDACKTTGGAFTGPGNICVDPKLVGGTNVHQTTLSPTIDKGSDELFHMVGGERENEDYEGDPRPTDGDGDGHTVDMGADESPAYQAPPPPPPHTPQCSDGADNDSDGAIDGADPGCLAGPTDDNEGDETPGDLVLCGQRTISLVRADVKGSKVELSGFVATTLAGQKVSLSVRYLGKRGKPKQLGSVTAGADGAFRGRVGKPSRKLFNVARYRAQVGSAKSVELKLPQSLASSRLKQVAGGMLELRGQVDRTVLGKRNAVVIKRILCGRYTKVGEARPNKKGAYVVRFPAPPSQGSALYRAETKVLARPGSKRYVTQFARAIGISF